MAFVPCRGLQAMAFLACLGEEARKDARVVMLALAVRHTEVSIQIHYTMPEVFRVERSGLAESVKKRNQPQAFPPHVFQEC